MIQPFGKSVCWHLLKPSSCVSCDLVIPLLGINPTEIYTYMHQETCEKKFMAALFALVPGRNNPNAYNGSMAKEMVVCSHSVKPSTMAVNKPQTRIKTWMNLTHMILGERRQTRDHMP